MKGSVTFAGRVLRLVALACLVVLSTNLFGQDNSVSTRRSSQRHIGIGYPPKHLLEENFLINSHGEPLPSFHREREAMSSDILFYIIIGTLLLLAFLRVVYDKYFSNLLRVFFNTTLRQGQLTDQLLQAKLPSFFYNIYFILIGGLYLYLVVVYNSGDISNLKALTWCIGAVFAIYASKFCILRFAGWLSGYKQEAESYIFIVFLINKMIALLLVPIVLVIAFSGPPLDRIAIVSSYVLIILLLFMRYVRSYGLLRKRIKVSGIHFALYIIGIELLPLLLIYKAGTQIISKIL